MDNMEIAQRLKIKNKCECYTRKENILRKAIMNFTIDEKRAFNMLVDSDIKKLQVSMDVKELRNSLKILKEKNGFVADEDGNVNFVYPVSALETNHKVTLSDGRKFSAMCAIDAMGAAFTFHEDVVVESMCSNTGNSVRVEIKNGELYRYSPDSLYALHVDLNKHTDWASSC